MISARNLYKAANHQQKSVCDQTSSHQHMGARGPDRPYFTVSPTNLPSACREKGPLVRVICSQQITMTGQPSFLTVLSCSLPWLEPTGHLVPSNGQGKGPGSTRQGTQAPLLSYETTGGLPATRWGQPAWLLDFYLLGPRTDGPSELILILAGADWPPSAQ